MDLPLAAAGASYCPAFALLDADDDGLVPDEALAAALGRPVTDGCPEPRPGETGARWWAVTAKVGVATDDQGRPAHGDDTHVVDLGRGTGVLLVTDHSAAAALVTGELLGDATALVLTFDLDEVVAVETDTSLLRRRARSMSIELRGASWGAVGLAVYGEIDRAVAMRDVPVRRSRAEDLVDRLTSLLDG